MLGRPYTFPAGSVEALGTWELDSLRWEDTGGRVLVLCWKLMGD